MDRIYFRDRYKLYLGRFTENRPTRCSLWAFCLLKKEFIYIGYYNEEFELTIEPLPVDVEKNIPKLIWYLNHPYYKRSIPGIVKLRFA
jgi:hypothetical protein